MLLYSLRYICLCATWPFLYNVHVHVHVYRSLHTDLHIEIDLYIIYIYHGLIYIHYYMYVRTYITLYHILLYICIHVCIHIAHNHRDIPLSPPPSQCESDTQLLGFYPQLTYDGAVVCLHVCMAV